MPHGKETIMWTLWVHVCACKVEREKNVEETQGRKAKKKKSEREFGHGKARLMLAIDNKGRKRGGKKHTIHLKNSPSLKAPQRLCNRKGLLSAIFSPCFSFGAVSEG